MPCTDPLYAIQYLDNGQPYPEHHFFAKPRFVDSFDVLYGFNGDVYKYFEKRHPDLKRGIDYQPLVIPCGKCVSCRLAYARMWAVRGLMELKITQEQFKDSCFITLTFDDDHLPGPEFDKSGKCIRYPFSVDVRDLQLFIKNLRRKIEPLKIRYLACGEYGHDFGRPHYHLIIFGWSPPDLELEKVNAIGDKAYISKFLSKIWDKGMIYVGDVNENSIAYVAGYVTKKQEFKQISDKRSPPFITMSRKPALGFDFFSKYFGDFRHDCIHLDDKLLNIPRAFLRKVRDFLPEFYNEVKANRVSIAEDLFEQTYLEPRLRVRDKLATLKFNKLQRNL